MGLNIAGLRIMPHTLILIKYALSSVQLQQNIIHMM
ncbi:hypothetical protein Y788_06870 [Pantoea dispersa 625]|nr:hypothetical protein Y788_06870 [Pantoea dispersa 625]